MAYRLFLLLVASSLASALPGEEADSAPEISAARIKADVAYLASDRLEGRGPGTRPPAAHQADRQGQKKS